MRTLVGADEPEPSERRCVVTWAPAGSWWADAYWPSNTGPHTHAAPAILNAATVTWPVNTRQL
jgi:hypothetical protein